MQSKQNYFVDKKFGFFFLFLTHFLLWFCAVLSVTIVILCYSTTYNVQCTSTLHHCLPPDPVAILSDLLKRIVTLNFDNTRNSLPFLGLMKMLFWAPKKRSAIVTIIRVFWVDFWKWTKQVPSKFEKTHSNFPRMA